MDIRIKKKPKSGIEKEHDQSQVTCDHSKHGDTDEMSLIKAKNSPKKRHFGHYLNHSHVIPNLYDFLLWNTKVVALKFIQAVPPYNSSEAIQIGLWKEKTEI